MWEATIEALETIDACLARVVEAIEAGDSDRARSEIEDIMGRHHRFVLSLYAESNREGEGR